MSREQNRRGKKGGHVHHNSRYGNSSPNFHRHNNYMGADTPNWREPVSTETSVAAQQRAKLHYSYGEFLMKGWNEFEEEKKQEGKKSRIDSDKSSTNPEHRGPNQARTGN